jgi:hypothetical protein
VMANSRAISQCSRYCFANALLVRTKSSERYLERSSRHRRSLDGSHIAPSRLDSPQRRPSDAEIFDLPFDITAAYLLAQGYELLFVTAPDCVEDPWTLTRQEWLQNRNLILASWRTRLAPSNGTMGR